MKWEELSDFLTATSWRGSCLGLERMQELMGRLGHPERRLRFVHVAGTNGKGSVCAMLSRILTESGYKTGLYTSPHLHAVNERMRIDGAEISDAALLEIAEQVQAPIEAMTDSPTEFERITAMALLYFQQQGCDIVVLEVGLGGALDATNVIPTPELAVITALGLEHTRELGSTLEEIAAAKAGIIKAGGSVVSYGSEAESVVRELCRERGAAYTRADFSRLRVRSSDITGSTIDCLPLTGLRLPLAGLYQCRNAVLAVTAAECLQTKGWSKISERTIREGLASVQWSGRLELLRREPMVLLDGAHNPHGIAAVSESLRSFFPQGGLVFVLGVLADKDVGQMLDALCPLAKSFCTVTPPSPRALSAEELAKQIRARGGTAQAAESFVQAARRAMEQAGKDGVICALGSLYMSFDLRCAFAQV